MSSYTAVYANRWRGVASTAVSSEARAKLREWAVQAGKGQLLPSGSVVLASLKAAVQRFRVRHGLSCVIGPVWPVGAGCYSQAALPMPLSKPLYNSFEMKTLPDL